MIVVPEYILLKAIKDGLEFIKTDFDYQNINNTPENSYLYRITKNLGIERYQYYNQAQSVLFKEEDDPRTLTVDLMYNMNYDKFPSIYISLPGEQSSENSLSVEQGTIPYFNNQKDGSIDGYNNIFSRRKKSTYSIFIMSDNTNEVVMLYHIIDSLLISMMVQLTMIGLYNITLGGQDVQLNPDLVPKNSFSRAILISFEYSRSSPDLTKTSMFNEIFFKGLPKEY